MPSGKKARLAARTMRGTAAASVEGMQRNVLGAESARVDIQTSLGAAGSYDQPTAGLIPNVGNTAATGGLVQSKKAESFWATQGLPDSNVETLKTMDANAVSQRVKNSAEYRIRSRMTAESEQLLSRTGDLYDRFIKNQVTPVSEALGAAARESMAERKRMIAKGGAARRTAFEMESEIRQKEALASKKATEMSNIMMRTDEYARKYAETTLEGNQAWLNNLGGIRDDHVKLANNVYESMLQDALPTMYDAEMKQHELRAVAHAKKRQKSQMMIRTVASLVLAAVGGAGAMGAFGQGAIGTAMSTGGIGMNLAQAGLSLMSQQGGSAGFAGGVGSGLLDAYNARKQANQEQLQRIPGPTNRREVSGRIGPRTGRSPYGGG